MRKRCRFSVKSHLCGEGLAEMVVHYARSHCPMLSRGLPCPALPCPALPSPAQLSPAQPSPARDGTERMPRLVWSVLVCAGLCWAVLVCAELCCAVLSLYHNVSHARAEATRA